jgi:serine/threonine protein kinase
VFGFQPLPGSLLAVGASVFAFTPHPLFGAEMGEVFAIEGGQAVVYQLRDVVTDRLHALKVPKAAFRGEHVARATRTLAHYAHLPGLLLADRICLTAAQYPHLIAHHPALEYAILMPWLPGRSWAGVVADRALSQQYAPADALPLTAATAQVLWELEAHHLTHGDIAGSNVFVRPEGRGVELLDLEDLSIPGSLPPPHRGYGSPGYQHRSLGPEGQWCSAGDRFAGAILLTEMLAWWDPRVQELTPEGSESLFQPHELQEVGGTRWERMRDAIWALCPLALELFDRAWASPTLADCPELATWALTLTHAQQGV